MQSLCEALIYAIRHIESRPSNDEDSDVASLEEIAALRTAALKHNAQSLLANLGL